MLETIFHRVNCARDGVFESIFSFHILWWHWGERTLIIAKNENLPCGLTFQKIANDALIVTLKTSDFVTYSDDSNVWGLIRYSIPSYCKMKYTQFYPWMARAFLQKTLDMDIDWCWFLFPGAQGLMMTWLNYKRRRWPYVSALSLLKVWDMTNCDVCTHMSESGIHIEAWSSLGVTSHGWLSTRTLIDLKGSTAYHREQRFLAKLNEDSCNHTPSAGSAHLQYKHCGANIG